MKVFIDTSYFIAVLNPGDQWNYKAVNALKQEDEAITSSLIVNETVSLMQGRGHLSAAIEFLRDIRANPAIQIVHLDPGMQSEAWDLFARWGGAGANAIDCTSFAIMRRFNIRRALTFDDHFRVAGFATLR